MFTFPAVRRANRHITALSDLNSCQDPTFHKPGAKSQSMQYWLRFGRFRNRPDFQDKLKWPVRNGCVLSSEWECERQFWDPRPGFWAGAVWAWRSLDTRATKTSHSKSKSQLHECFLKQ